MKFRKIAAFICIAFVINLSSFRVAADDNNDQTDSEIFYGDINGDMKITAADYVAFMKYYTGYMTLPDSALLKADIDKNGIINIIDTIILKSLVLES